MAQLTRKRVILIEAESSYGTDPTPSATDVVLVTDLSITPQSSDVVNRDVVRPYLGSSQQLLANTRVECTFSVEFAGSGTAGTAPRYGSALKACGLSETIASGTSVTYEPISANFSSITIHYNVDGVRHIVTGCRGNVALSAEVGSIPTLDFTFTGIYNAPTDTALPSVTYGNQATPLIFKNGNTTSFQLLSFAGALQSLSFDMGNSIVYRELVGGTKEVLLTDRAANGSVSIEAPALSSKDFFAAALVDTTLGNLTVTHGTAAGNICRFSSTKVDIGDVTYGEMDGVTMLEIPYTLVPSSANDELSIRFT
jgi:hypothetical protein|tara:strand:+ start:1044 stop:1976 length:933 start_codon:yes stop_codon:yes gene_type:complete